MANLDVALRLRLINGIKAPSAEAKRDLDALHGSAQRLNGVRAGGLAADLGRVATTAGRADDALRRTASNRAGLAATGAAAGRLGADLGTVAGRAGQADAAMRRLGAERSGLVAVGTASARLGGDLSTLAGDAGRADAALRRVGGDRSGLVSAGASARALQGDLEAAAAAGDRAGRALRDVGNARLGRPAGLDDTRAYLWRTVQAGEMAGATEAQRRAAERSRQQLERLGGAIRLDVGATGQAVGRLGGSLDHLSAAAVRTDATLRRIGTERAGLAAGSAAASRLGNDLRSLERSAVRADGALDRLGATRTGLATAGSATARLSGELAGAARNAGRLADNLTRATTVVPRIRAPQVEAPAPGPWGPRPTGPAPAPRPVRSTTRSHGPLAPEDELRTRAAAGADGTIVAFGNKAMAAAGSFYVARGAIRATVGEAISFEKAWAEVVKKVNDAPNPEAMQQLQRSVAKMAIDLGLPRNGMAEMTAEAGAAGVKFQDLERRVRLAAKASVGWDMAPREAAQSLAEIASATQFTAAELDVLADKINALGDNSPAKEADIVKMFQSAAAPAKQAGSSYDTTLTAVTALKSGGMQPDVASRFYGAFTSKLRTAGGEGKGAEKVNDALKEIGLNGKKVAEAMARDADAAIIDVLTRLSKHADPVKVSQGLMGQEWWDELARFSGGSLAEFAKQREMLRNPLNYRGSLDKGLVTQLSTTANHMERMKALSGDVGDRLGRWALPAINKNIEIAIQQMDELEKRRALRQGSGGGEDWLRFLARRFTPLSVFHPDYEQTTADGLISRGTGWLYRKGLDATVGQPPTEDRSRLVVEEAAKRAEDDRQAAEKARAEAAKLEERAKGSKDKTARAILLEQARREREAASRHDVSAAEATRGAGPAGARDMTGVEFGEAAARASVEAMRRIALMERGLAAGRPNVRVPDTGVVMSREAAQAELLALRRQYEALGGPPAEPQAPAATPPAPAAPVMTVPLPPARPGTAPPPTPLPPIRPASLTPPAATVQPDATVQPAPTIQPQPTIQPAPVAPQPAPVARAGEGQPAVQPPASPPPLAAPVQPRPTVAPAPAPAPAASAEAAGTVAALQQRIGVLERALATGSQANVRIPDTGIITARRGVEAEIAELRRQVESRRPAPAASAPERPAVTVPASVPPIVQPVAAIPPAPAVPPPAVPVPTVAPAQPRPVAAPAPAPVASAGAEAAGTVAALQQRIGVLERALATGSQANVRIPDTGIITARRGVETEIAELRKRVEASRPVPAAPAPERPVPRPAPGGGGPSAPAGTGLGDAIPRTGKPLAPSGDVAPRVDPQPALDGIRAVEEGAKRLKTTMGQDLSAPARESMQSYTVALKAGTAEAIASASAAAAQMKAALSFTATPTISPRLVAPSGAGAGAGAGAAPARAPAAAPAAPGSAAPRVQSAGLRQGRGQSGPVFTGPIHVHGVKDVAGMHRQISRIADRRARDARDGALHDTGVESA